MDEKKAMELNKGNRVGLRRVAKVVTKSQNPDLRHLKTQIKS